MMMKGISTGGSVVWHDDGDDGVLWFGVVVMVLMV